ncbi:MAG TPA: response regulator [Candidatus Methylomirabilis sp.]
MPSKVLVVYDDASSLNLLRMHLERDGYAVFTAGSGPEGLRLAYEHKPDAVILDVRMPGMGGHEVCGRLRDISDAAILFVTVLKAPEDIVRGLELGAHDYIIKPFNYGELLVRLEACLRRRAAPPGAGCRRAALALVAGLAAARGGAGQQAGAAHPQRVRGAAVLSRAPGQGAGVGRDPDGAVGSRVCGRSGPGEAVRLSPAGQAGGQSLRAAVPGDGARGGVCIRAGHPPGDRAALSLGPAAEIGGAADDYVRAVEQATSSLDAVAAAGRPEAGDQAAMFTAKLRSNLSLLEGLRGLVPESSADRLTGAITATRKGLDVSAALLNQSSTHYREIPLAASLPPRNERGYVSSQRKKLPNGDRSLKR